MYATGAGRIVGQLLLDLATQSFRLLLSVLTRVRLLHVVLPQGCPEIRPISQQHRGNDDALRVCLMHRDRDVVMQTDGRKVLVRDIFRRPRPRGLDTDLGYCPLGIYGQGVVFHNSDHAPVEYLLV